MKTPLRFAISKETFTAKVDVPELVPGLNFFPHQRYPLFQIIAALSVVPDLHFTDSGYEPSRRKARYITPATDTTPWLYVREGSSATTLELKLQPFPTDTPHAWVLSVGVFFGTPAGPEIIEEIKHVGGGKIIGVV